MEGTEAASGALGKYRLIAELGHGGMAQVFLALARGPAGFNKLVVIKQIRDQLADDPEFLNMFLDEARLAARLNHPNVVQTNEVGEDGKRYFICMEYLEGQPLNRVLQRLGREGVPLGTHLRLLVDVLAGLHHAHELTDYDGTPLQVVHRDVTPHNIFITYNGQVKVVDFGIAKALSQSAETKAGVLKGKVAYMAPEQARGDKVDRRADVFSVGVMMWEALVGRRMFKGLTDVVIIQKIVNGQLQRPRDAKSDVDERLEAVCLKALAHNRDDRYASAAEFQAALEAALDAVGDRSSLRDAGKMVTQAFEVERHRIKSLLEASMSPTSTTRLSADFSNEVSSISKIGAAAAGAHLPIIENPATFDPDSHPKLTGTPSSHSTEGATITKSAIVQDAAQPKKNKLILPIVAIGAGAAIAIAYFAFGNKTDPQGGAAPPTTSAPAKPASHTLKLESNPQGATIKEGDKELGKTPMAITLDPNQKGDRVFTVTMDGYHDYTVRQDPSDADVRVMASLAKKDAPVPVTTATAAETASATAKGPRYTPPAPVAPGPAPAPAPAPPPPSSTLDIKLNR